MRITLSNGKELHVAESMVEIMKRCPGFNRFFKLWDDGKINKVSGTLIKNDINYISFRTDDGGLVSFLPKGRELVFNERDEWSREGRQTGKPVKILRQVFAPRFLEIFKITDECLQRINSSCKVEVELEFSGVERTKSINQIYDCQTTGDWSNESCMNGDGYMGFVEQCGTEVVYIKNSEGELLGRALLWHGVTVLGKEEKVTVMDRQYGSDVTRAKLSSYGTRQGWLVRAYNCTGDKECFIMPDGNVNFQVKLELAHNGIDDGQMPYLDTFTYMDENKMSNDVGRYLPYTADNTDGSLSGYHYEDNHDGESYAEIDDGWYADDDVSTCDFCHRTAHIESLIRMEDDNDVCQRCADRNYVITQENWRQMLRNNAFYCERSGYYYASNENLVYSVWHGTYIEKGISQYCTYLNDYSYIDRCVEIETAVGKMWVYRDYEQEAYEKFGKQLNLFTETEGGVI